MTIRTGKVRKNGLFKVAGKNSDRQYKFNINNGRTNVVKGGR